MQPVLLANQTPVDPNLNAGTLVGANQTNQPAVNAVVEFWGVPTAQVTCVFNDFLFEQPSILILPEDIINRIFTDITDKDLCLCTLTCTALFKMRTIPQNQQRVHDFKIITGLFHFSRGLSEMMIIELIQAVNKRPLDYSEKERVGDPLSLIERYTCSVLPQEGDFNKEMDANKCEYNLFNRFNECCRELKTKQNSNDFIFCANAVVGKLTKKSVDLDIASESMRVKLEATANRFYNKVHHEIILAFAYQPIATLTPFRFKEQVKELKALFPQYTIAQIETSLRRAIRNPANQAAMVAFVAALMDTDPKAPQLRLFLNELLIPVAPGQEMARSAALHAIIG